MNCKTKALFDFIKASPDPYHTVREVEGRLREAGYTAVSEDRIPSAPGRYYTVRGGSSLVAFRIPERVSGGFMITASHCDSPSFRLKPIGDTVRGGYTVSPVEKYGGSIHYSWMDRPLELSGRAVVRTEDGVSERLFRSGCAAGLIPSVAIHMNREANKSLTLDVARDMLPLVGDAEDGGSLVSAISRLTETDEDALLSFDGVFSCMEEGVCFGAGGKYIAAPRLDDLMCAFTMLCGFIDSAPTEAVPVYCLYDGEEIGSRLREGAASDLLPSALRSLAEALFPGERDPYRRMLASSFLVSSDNAHAVHPNHPELDGGCGPLMNGGVTVKRSASGSYMTDSTADAVVVEICRRAAVPVQHYSNRSDLPGGSTLGAIAVPGLPVLCADIGAAQLAMHSAVESAGERDVCHMADFARAFYSTLLLSEGESIKIITA